MTLTLGMDLNHVLSMWESMCIVISTGTPSTSLTPPDSTTPRRLMPKSSRKSRSLVALHKQGIAVTGIAYLHNITDRRMSGSSLQALKTFKAMCGKQSYPHVSLVTNMASNSGSSSAEEDNLGQLVARTDWWGDMVTRGSRIMKHTGTADSAKRILQASIAARGRTLLLTIQKELVDDGLDLDYTSAGWELNREIRQAVEQLQVEMRRLREESREVRDADMQRLLEEQRNELQKQIDQALESQRSMNITLENLAAQKVEEERKRLNDLASWEMQRDKLKAQQKQKEDIHLEEKRRLLQELEKRPRQSDIARLKTRMKHMEIQHKKDRAKDQEALHDLDESIDRGRKEALNGNRWRLFQVCAGVATIVAGIVMSDLDLAISGLEMTGGGFS
ncbi:hypothetical protein CPLU01_11016 [Colletotrichum plurivorum]|uniref:Uncharacterized protein n=1 Tax=Colletotrichum plurivorum TaxID=2175906 RepID=A0A8H6K2Z3_9PEZI|nr:hypothetical protein CPLU01_11016 [Colletotrichum plurivorum]